MITTISYHYYVTISYYKKTPLESSKMHYLRGVARGRGRQCGVARRHRRPRRGRQAGRRGGRRLLRRLPRRAGRPAGALASGGRGRGG